MKNVVLLHVPRGGSSMITHIFARHGFACENKPEAAQNTQDGAKYDSWEWLHLKRWRNRNRVKFDGMWEGKEPFRYRHVKRYQQTLDRLPSPWVTKDFGASASLYDGVDCMFIGVIRRPESNALSMAAKKGESYSETLPRIVNFQEQIYATGCPIVYVDDVIDGDLSSLKRAAGYAGFVLDEGTVAEVVDPSKWHY